MLQDGEVKCDRKRCPRSLCNSIARQRKQGGIISEIDDCCSMQCRRARRHHRLQHHPKRTARKELHSWAENGTTNKWEGEEDKGKMKKKCNPKRLLSPAYNVYAKTSDLITRIFFTVQNATKCWIHLGLLLLLFFDKILKPLFPFVGKPNFWNRLKFNRRGLRGGRVVDNLVSLNSSLTKISPFSAAWLHWTWDSI